MRNYLLATAALVGFVAAGSAQAATFAPSDPSRNSSAFGSPQTKPEPGKIIVHMGGLIAVDAVAANSNADKSAVTGAKNSPVGMDGYFRLYFGFDGKLTNGMIYGAKSEMRTNFASPVAGTSGGSFASTWSTRRAYGYIGGDSWGIVRIGQGDGPLSLFTGGGITTGEAFSTGGWDGDIGAFVGNGSLAWGFYDVGAEYVPNKITWISPSWGGLNIGASFAPSNAALNGNANSTAIAGGNNSQITSNLTGDLGRPRNIFEVAARWQGNLGPVAVDAMLGYYGADVVKPSATAVFPGGVTSYKNPSVIDAGLSVTYLGASVFGHVNSGSTNGVAAPRQVLASGRKKDHLAWVIGAQYSTGPYTVGTSWYQFDSQGSSTAVGTGAAVVGNRQERGFALGGQYTVVTGFDVFLEYLWGSRKQSGVNFVDGAAGPAANNNKVTTSAVVATALWRW